MGIGCRDNRSELLECTMYTAKMYILLYRVRTVRLKIGTMKRSRPALFFFFSPYFLLHFVPGTPYWIFVFFGACLHNAHCPWCFCLCLCCCLVWCGSCFLRPPRISQARHESPRQNTFYLSAWGVNAAGLHTFPLKLALH